MKNVPCGIYSSAFLGDQECRILQDLYVVDTKYIRPSLHVASAIMTLIDNNAWGPMSLSRFRIFRQTSLWSRPGEVEYVDMPLFLKTRQRKHAAYYNGTPSASKVDRWDSMCEDFFNLHKEGGEALALAIGHTGSTSEAECSKLCECLAALRRMEPHTWSTNPIMAYAMAASSLKEWKL